VEQSVMLIPHPFCLHDPNGSGEPWQDAFALSEPTDLARAVTDEVDWARASIDSGQQNHRWRLMPGCTGLGACRHRGGQPDAHVDYEPLSGSR
jgi:hypothetical protein